jgi:hypothetical protein
MDSSPPTVTMPWDGKKPGTIAMPTSTGDRHQRRRAATRGRDVARAARSVAALDVVCRTRISPKIVTAATTYKAVWQSTFLPQFSGKRLTHNGVLFRGDWPFAIRGTNPNNDFGC